MWIWTYFRFSSVQSLSRVWPQLCLTLCSMPGLPVYQQLPEFTQTHVHWVGDAIWPSYHLLSSLLFSIFPSIRIFQMNQFFSSGGQSTGASASASVLPMNIQDWSPLGWIGWLSLKSKGLKNLQHHSSKASILQHSAFFIVQVSHLYMTTRKTIALIRQTFVDKVIFLLFNMLPRLVIAFLPRSKHL